MQRFNPARALKYAKEVRASQTGNLKLRAPIEPSVKDVKVSETHPLWQFFDNQRQYIRKAQDLQDIGAAWSIPQLRRKGFTDLHQLWYVCLKEMNRLSREERLLAQYENRPSEDTRKMERDSNTFSQTIHEVKTTMWRIRHVLAERYHAHQRLNTFEFDTEFQKALDEFKEQYLTADSNADGQVNAQLERFQFAFFGINPMLETNFPEPRLVKGLYLVAQLKLERYAGEESQVTDVKDIREAYTLFTAEPTPEGVSSAIKTLLEVREAGEPVPRSQDVEVLAELMLA